MPRLPNPAWLFVGTAMLASGADRLSPGHPELLQPSILQAYRSGLRRLTIPPGTYRINPPRDGPHLQFSDLSDFEIDGRGVFLLFADQTRAGIEFRNCRNIRFHGARIAYETPPFSQAVIEGIAPDGAWYDVRIEPGYPTNLDDPRNFSPHFLAHLFDAKSRQLKPKSYDLYPDTVQRTGPDRFRLHWNRPSGPKLHPVSIGDLIAIRGSGPHTVTVIGCARIELADVTIYNAPNFAIWESQGDGDNRYSVTVTRGPRPVGARTDPLLSSTADAFHSTEVRKGPVLENCAFDGMGDDAIAIHGTYSFVFRAEENRLTINRNTFRPGDPLRLFDSTGRPKGEAIVQSIRPLPGFVNAQKSARTARDDNTLGPYAEVTLDRPLPAIFDDVAGNPTASGSGYVIRNNRIGRHRARGMLLKADNGLVERNVIDGSSMGAIVLSPELWWNEASYSRNVILRSNTIRNVADSPESFAAVVVANTESPVEGCGHRNIAVQDNIFENLDVMNLYVSSACRVTVAGNRFVRATSGPVIRLIHTDSVTFQSNQVVSTAPSRDNIITIENATNIRGAATGLETCTPGRCR